MASTLSALPVGSKVTVQINGQDLSFLVVHQGNPDPSLYDASCTGTWLMMEPLYTLAIWGKTDSYCTGYSHLWMNDILFPKIDSSLQTMVRTVKLPYTDSSGVHSGADGVECRIFLPAAYELGWDNSYQSAMLADGACLDYFKDFENIDSRRVARTLSGSPDWYWTRTFRPDKGNLAWAVVSNGDCTTSTLQSDLGLRPVMIFDPNTTLDKNGAVQPNSAPIITSPGGASGSSLGIRTGPFLLEYTATDPEGSSVHLTEELDTQTTRTLDADSGTVQQFQALNDSRTFLQLSNAAHTVQVTASDGLLSSQLSLTFTKAVTRATLTLTQPLQAAAPIRVAVMAVAGEIPEDAEFSVQVTNSALDPEPVWQDATDEVRRGRNILFENAAAGQPAFNFLIQAARGPSGTGGHIDQVAGAFQ